MRGTTTLTARLATHPKLTGALWFLILLVAETGTVLGTGGGGKVGP